MSFRFLVISVFCLISFLGFSQEADSLDFKIKQQEVKLDSLKGALKNQIDIINKEQKVLRKLITQKIANHKTKCYPRNPINTEKIVSDIKEKYKQNFNLTYDLKQKLKNEINDSSSTSIRKWYSHLDSLSQKELTFAKAEFDSIVLVEYNNTRIANDSLILFWGDFFKSPKSNFEKARYNVTNSLGQNLIDYLNNPNNYNWSECGSPIAEYEMQLFQSGILKQRVVISCGFTQIDLSHPNSIIKYGALIERGENSKLYNLISAIKQSPDIK